MGFVQLPSLSNFDKAIFSFFFRVPQASIDAAIANWGAARDAAQVGPDYLGGPMQGVIPLFCWGPPATFIGGTGQGNGSLGPSIIGIQCNDYGDPLPAASMYAKLQYQTGSKLPDSGRPDSGSWPDWFEIGIHAMDTGNSAFYQTNPNYVPVTADVWHHGLISFDVSGGCSIAISPWVGGELVTSVAVSSGCSFYMALDDVNYNGAYLGPNSPGACSLMTGEQGLNKIWTTWCNWFGDPVLLPVNPSSGTTGPLPASPIGMPGSAEALPNIYEVEMAYCQVFTGQSLDISIPENRRLFIDENGNPVDPEVAETALGIAPDIRFVAASDWITGTNTGSAGHFTPVGTINKFSTNPKLGT